MKDQYDKYQPDTSYYTEEELTSLAKDDVGIEFDNARLQTLIGIEQMVEIIESRPDLFKSPNHANNLSDTLKTIWSLVSNS